MKHKIFALILALTVASWAQTATQTPTTPPASTAPAEKAKPSCCDKMSGMKDGASCARHGKQNADAKAGSCCAGKEASCCGGKDAMSCMKDKADKTATSCCKEGCTKDKTAAACCGSGKSCGKSCCSSDKEKTAKNCCEKPLQS